MFVRRVMETIGQLFLQIVFSYNLTGRKKAMVLV